MGLIDKIIQDVAELPDRTSPEDKLEMMLVSADELRAILMFHLSDELRIRAVPRPPFIINSDTH